MAISTTAKKRVTTLKTGGPGMFAGSPSVTRTTPAGHSREAVSAADLQQITNRQEAEALPEGNVRRKRKSSGGY